MNLSDKVIKIKDREQRRDGSFAYCFNSGGFVSLMHLRVAVIHSWTPASQPRKTFEQWLGVQPGACF